jgi:hypothetical protein
MRITRVEAENLKGRSFAYDLSPQVAIVGDNFSGKTSIIDAIRLALIGYIPELGKLPKATAQLASDQYMAVSLSFDQGECTQLIVKDGRVTRFQEKGLDEIPLLNAAAYLGMRDRERYQYVFGIAKTPNEFTPASIEAELEQISFEDAPSEELVRAKAAVIKTVANHLRTVTPFQQALSDTIEELKMWFAKYNARAKDTQGAVRVLTELKNRQETMAGNVQQFAEADEDARVASQKALETLLQTKERAKAALTYDQRATRVKELQEAVLSTEETDKLERLIAEATASLKPEVESKYSTADLEALRWAHSEAMTAYNGFSVRLKDTDAERKALVTQAVCPHCGAKGKHWKNNLRATLDARTKVLREAVEISAQGLVERKAEMDEAEREVKRAQDELAHNRVVNENILGWQKQLEKARKFRDQWQGQLDKEIAQLSREQAVPVTAEELAKALNGNTDAEKAYTEARRRLREAQLLEHDLKRAAQSQLEHEDAAANVAVIKVFGKVLREKQAALVDLVFGDLLKIANGIVGAILASPLAFHEGEVGRWDGHRWVSHKTFSGTEQALTFVAIAAALSQGAPLRLLIFDELGRLDAMRREQIIGLLKKALADGHIDQFIVAGAVELEGLHPSAAGIQVIEL